ncbi:hypothetical protein HDU87_001965 [Geranomyces variabilis]|uniref:Uncharacterized protein n=1 Tax=Geranomyces variabilis TaxID=109894 RepID=A0AAD5XNK0_9FUNG|nr:hypothetical protein HDU87_001965 [Geranomyces variabilis]
MVKVFWVHPNLGLSCSTRFTRCEIDGSVWEGVGVAPHVACAADDALDVALHEALELIVPDLEADPVLRKRPRGRGAATFGRVTLDEAVAGTVADKTVAAPGDVGK